MPALVGPAQAKAGLLGHGVGLSVPAMHPELSVVPGGPPTKASQPSVAVEAPAPTRGEPTPNAPVVTEHMMARIGANRQRAHARRMARLAREAEEEAAEAAAPTAAAAPLEAS